MGTAQYVTCVTMFHVSHSAHMSLTYSMCHMCHISHLVSHVSCLTHVVIAMCDISLACNLCYVCASHMLHVYASMCHPTTLPVPSMKLVNIFYSLLIIDFLDLLP